MKFCMHAVALENQTIVICLAFDRDIISKAHVYMLEWILGIED